MTQLEMHLLGDSKPSRVDNKEQLSQTPSPLVYPTPKHIPLTPPQSGHFACLPKNCKAQGDLPNKWQKLGERPQRATPTHKQHSLKAALLLQLLVTSMY